MNPSNAAAPVGQNTPKAREHRPYAMAVTRRKLQPGAPGTRKIWTEYGEKLVCVRYRYDPENKRRIKTIELVIEERPWQPRPAKIPLNPIMHLRIKYGEVAVGKQVKGAGGKWNRDLRVWELPYQEVLKLGLAERIVDTIKN